MLKTKSDCRWAQDTEVCGTDAQAQRSPGHRPGLTQLSRRWLSWSWVALLLAVVAMPTTANAMNGGNTVGINVHVPIPSVVELASNLGVQWVRMDNPWHYFYTDPCAPDMPFSASIDTAVQHAVQHGLNIYMGLGFTPPCASTGGLDNIGFNDPPEPLLFYLFVRRMVARYRGFGVRHYGLWNEPNLSFFFEGTPEQYINHVVLPGFAAVTAGCLDAGYTDCVILGPDLAHQYDYDVFLKDILKRMLGIGVMFDIFTHHIYQPVATPLWERDSFVNALDDQRLEATRPSLIDVLYDVGLAPDRIPVFDVWITETGKKAEPTTDPQEMADQASKYMEVLNVQAARSWYTNTIFYEIIDAPAPSEAGFGIAVLQEDGTFFLKDAYFALQNRLTSDLRFSPYGPPAGYRPNTTTTCARLGKSGFIRIPDQDRFEFHGQSGELVTVTVDRHEGHSFEGHRATLILEGHGLYYVSRGPLLNDITTTLPASGRYKIHVMEQMGIEKGAPFRGDYCVSLESSFNAHTTLKGD